MKENVKNDIIKQSIKLFSSQGVANSSIRDIAAKVGIREGTIYNYFNSKDEIYTCILDEFKRLNKIIGVEDLIFTENINEETIREWINCVSLFFDRPDIELSKDLCVIVSPYRNYSDSLNQYLTEFFQERNKTLTYIFEQSWLCRNNNVFGENTKKNIEYTVKIIEAILIKYYETFTTLKTTMEIRQLQNKIYSQILYMVNKI